MRCCRWLGKRQMAEVMAALLVLVLAGTGPVSLQAQAKARIARAPAGVSVTKDGLVVDETAAGTGTGVAGTTGTAGESNTGAGNGANGSSAAGATEAGMAAAAAAAGQTVVNGLPLNVTVLDADDFYYARSAAPVIITQAGQRFHNVRVQDPQALVQAKLGTAFQKIELNNGNNTLELYQDVQDGTYYLWVQYDANLLVQFLVYQQVVQTQ